MLGLQQADALQRKGGKSGVASAETCNQQQPQIVVEYAVSDGKTGQESYQDTAAYVRNKRGQGEQGAVTVPAHQQGYSIPEDTPHSAS